MKRKKLWSLLLAGVMAGQLFFAESVPAMAKDSGSDLFAIFCRPDTNGSGEIVENFAGTGVAYGKTNLGENEEDGIV